MRTHTHTLSHPLFRSLSLCVALSRSLSLSLFLSGNLRNVGGAGLADVVAWFRV